jgi:dipeptidyl aminopeptidase/acylaminoacyl peptidase
MKTWTLAVLLAAPASAATFSASEMMKLKRLADPHVSPDGKWVVFTVTEIDMAANGARNAELWLLPVAGGEPRRLTNHPRSDTRGRFSPDGRRLAFLSARDGSSQVHLLELAGGEPRKVTSLSSAVNSFWWADDKTLVVASDVYPECGADDACNKKNDEEGGKGSSARVYTELLYRHWDTWEDKKTSHLLAVSVDSGAARDLTPRGTRDVPPFSLGGPEDVAVAPDGSEVCFVRNDDPVPAISTNAELYVVPLAGGAARKIAGSAGYDGGPRYSPDGAKIAFRAQMRAGYESDRWRLLVYDRKSGAATNLTEAFDRHVEGYAWSPDSKTLYFVAGDDARQPIFSVPAAGGAIRKLVDGSFDDLHAAADGQTLVATQVSLTHPAEIVRMSASGSGLTRVTKLNDELLAGFRLQPGESVRYKGAAGKQIQAFVVKPPVFDAAKKYPLLVLIHGGPQGVWADAWSYRWNPQVFASAGYVVFMPNPRGSLGFGQELVDDINADWAGRAYEDIMMGTDHAEALPYVEKGRTSAAGASYGGYMINWIAGHTDRYKALVSHDGVFDLVSMYGATEELWFVEWEFRGSYWDNPQMYARWTPSARVKNFKTPTLVIHGEQDHRVPLEQGLQMFTALKRRGVPAKLVVFPDENHWVLRPVNSVRWYQEVIGWLDQWTKK